MKLLALIFAYAISHFITKPQRFRLFGWFKSWSVWLSKKLHFMQNEFIIIIIIALPVMVISVFLMNIFTSVLGGLLVAIMVLSYCIGPESLEEDFESGELRKRIGVRANAKIPVLIKKITQVSLRRWFGVFFWYVLLGIAGALIYRFSERLDAFTKNDEEIKPAIDRLIKILNYPVAWMMVVSLAIASDFERIFKKCKPFMNLNNLTSMDDSFLYEAADFAVENCEVESDEEKCIEHVSIRVLKRMLVVWLVFVSILVILAV
ncbi:MAG: hypothetical protein JKY19_07885 [Alcanivoracaceae bacterium]|nr:hypothetical protein [Alcanivoracaceae bacterium]